MDVFDILGARVALRRERRFVPQGVADVLAGHSPPFHGSSERMAQPANRNFRKPGQAERSAVQPTDLVVIEATRNPFERICSAFGNDATDAIDEDGFVAAVGALRFRALNEAFSRPVVNAADENAVFAEVRPPNGERFRDADARPTQHLGKPPPRRR